MNDRKDSVRAALRGNRLVCSALLLGQVMMAVVIAIALGSGVTLTPVDDDTTRLFAWIGVAAGLGMLPVAYLLRQLIWRKGAQGNDATVLQAFFAGNIAFQAVLEGAGLLNLTFWFITAEALPYAPVVGVLILFGIAALLRASPLR